MTGKVKTEESRNEIRKSPRAPKLPAKATIFCFQVCNEITKYSTSRDSH
jgi:hypothetical protein